MLCPRCSAILMPTHETGNRYECPRCRGVASTRADVGLMIGVRRRSDLHADVGQRGEETDLACPFCSTLLSRLVVGVRAGEIEIDVCGVCEGAWLDHPELAHFSSIATEVEADALAAESLAVAAAPPIPSGLLSQIVRTLRGLIG